jgi:hypothetical protein
MIDEHIPIRAARPSAGVTYKYMAPSESLLDNTKKKATVYILKISNLEPCDDSFQK